jgi:hypothetical protein
MNIQMPVLPVLAIVSGLVVLVLLGGCGGDRFNRYQHPLCDHNRSACR